MKIHLSTLLNNGQICLLSTASTLPAPTFLTRCTAHGLLNHLSTPSFAVLAIQASALIIFRVQTRSVNFESTAFLRGEEGARLVDKSITELLKGTYINR